MAHRIDRPLADPPPDGRARELWLQHVAGAILMNDVYEHALGGREGATTADEALVFQAVLGLAEVLDGYSGSVRNDAWEVSVRGHVVLTRRGSDGTDDEVVVDLDLFDGDGMAVGAHGWRDRDFGTDPVFADGPP